MDRHLAIRNTHSTVVIINGEKDAWDKEGNVVELDESKIKTEMDRLQAEWDANQYQRDRQAEYPSVQELVVALYDTDDKSVIEAKRAEVKKKYPKPE